MKDYIEHILEEIKHNRLSKQEGLEQIRQFRSKGNVVQQTPDGGQQTGMQESTLMLAPVWDIVAATQDVLWPAADTSVVLIGGDASRFEWMRKIYPFLQRPELSATDNVEQLLVQLKAIDKISHICWVAPVSFSGGLSDERLIDAQYEGVLSLFRLTKALLQLNYATTGIGLTIITEQALEVNLRETNHPANAGVHGIASVIAKEYPSWKVRLLDLEENTDWEQAAVFNVPPSPEGETFAYRNTRWFNRKFVPYTATDSSDVIYRQKGVYVVIGGSGGVGEVWSHYLADRYDAQLVWIGRRKADEDIQTKLEKFKKKRPYYISADASDSNALKDALQDAQRQFGAIHGIVHSALEVADKSIADLKEEEFRRGVKVKANIAVRIAQAVGNDRPDFILFFSSMAAFTREAGHSVYASACTFKDAFALQLAKSTGITVKVMNWGYWGDIGAGGQVPASFRARLSKAGIGSITAEDGMKSLDSLMAANISQIGLTKVNTNFSMPQLLPQTSVTAYTTRSAPVIDRLQQSARWDQALVDRMYSEVEDPMNAMGKLLCHLLFGQLQSLGFFHGAIEDVSEQRVVSGVLPIYYRWLEESLLVLSRHDFVRLTDNVWYVTDYSPVDMDAVWGEWDSRKEAWLSNPHIKAKVVLLEVSLKALPEVLTGRKQSTQIMFPNSSMKLVEGIYKYNLVADYFNEVLADTVVDYLNTRIKDDPAVRIRIIEIGAGTGGTSAMVFKKLAGYHQHVAEYCYTDLSRAFLMHADREFGSQNPFLTYRIFDAGKPPAMQDVPVETYDLVVATNVLHATKNIRETLRNTKALLKKNGLVLLNELSSNNMVNHLAFSLLEGWWLSEDEELRIPGCPGLFPHQWQEVLENEGFDHVIFPAEGTHTLGQQIVVAQSNGVVRQAMATEQPVTEITRETAQAAPQAKPVEVVSSSVANDQQREDKVKAAIIDKLTISLKIGRKQINANAPFADYGLDSITGVHFIELLNQELAISLSTTTLFDHSSVNQLTSYLLETYPSLVHTGQMTEVPVTVAEKTDVAIAAATEQTGKEGIAEKEAIAVIGISGRFPGADNVDELWEHLAAGNDLVGSVKRWDLSSFFPDGRYCDKGGFLDDITRFDPDFFGISGLEATYMDPQHRIFLEETWKALEDAGYAGADMEGKTCGIYVGCHAGDYQDLFSGHEPAQAMWGNASSVVPARIAYFLNLKGPAVSVDTACSSSLMSIHLACQGLWTGETQMAIAGGIFVQSTPKFYVFANRAEMLSPTGHCHTFDEAADGFVPGEGVGVVILKRLSEALAAGDHIYGVIAGSGINQDGTTNGITAPSAISQERLVSDVYTSFGIDAASVQMIEAHGTGTRLGDPIEFEAITRAFRKQTNLSGYCSIGSIKTNIGHTSAAAGVAGLIKVLLSLKHKKIPASLYYKQGNPRINFNDSPFYVNTVLRPWDINAGKKRMAAVSSFGFSGTNAHLVIAEAPDATVSSIQQPAYLVVLSARSAEQLRQQADMLAIAIGTHQYQTAAISYTLLNGRRHLTHRLACVVTDSAELKRLLEQWLEKGKVAGIYTGIVADGEEGSQTALKQYGNECIAFCRSSPAKQEFREKLVVVAELFTQGYQLKYGSLLENGHRISLPSYPFVKEQYWLPDTAPQSGTTSLNGVLHPMLHRNISSLSFTRYESTFTGKEFFLSDHVVNGKHILPGVAYLEMAREAVAQALTDHGGPLPDVRLQNITWLQPFAVNGHPESLQVRLQQLQDTQVSFEIFSKNGNTEFVHSQGQAVPVAKPVLPAQSIEAIKAACHLYQLSGEQCYLAFSAMGLAYGPAHKCIEEVFVGRDKVLARLVVPEVIATTSDAYTFHPALLDAALQAAMALNTDLREPSRIAPDSLALPFILQEAEVVEKITTPVLWVIARNSAESRPGEQIVKLDVDVCDATGRTLVRLRGFSAKIPQRHSGVAVNSPATVADQTSYTSLLTPVWNELLHWTPVNSHLSKAATVAIAGGTDAAVAQVRAHFPQSSILAIRPEETVNAIVERLNGFGPVDHLVWIASYTHFETITDSGIISTQQTTVLALFRLIKALLAVGYGIRELQWTIITVKAQAINKHDHIQAAAAGIHGLAGSMAKEYGNWSVRIVDVDDQYHLPVGDLFSLPADKAGDAYAFRQGAWYQQGLLSIPPTRNDAPVYRKGGVYVVIGGASGIGKAWSEHLVSAYQAQIVWIGRRPEDTAIQAAISVLKAAGKAPVYIQADATNETSLAAACRETEQRFGRIHGIVHSAIVLQDRGLASMEETQFMAGLSPKVDVCVNIAKVFRHVHPDFVLFFSGIMSFIKAAGQSNYAAGCTFKDAFAHQLATEWPVSVKVMNWGYWGTLGIVASKEYQDRMTAAGILSISPDEGMRALDTLMTGSFGQIAFAKTTQAVPLIAMLPSEKVAIYNDTIPSLIGALGNAAQQTDAESDTLYTAVLSELSDRAALLFGAVADGVEPDAPLTEYGFDELALAGVLNHLNERYGLQLVPSMFAENITFRQAATQVAGLRPGTSAIAAAYEEKADRIRRTVLPHMQEMDAMLAKVLWSILGGMGLWREQVVTVDSLLSGTTIRPGFRRWLEESLEALVRKGYLLAEKTGYTVQQTFSSAPDVVWSEWHQQKRAWLNNPSLQARVKLLEETLKVLPEILTGEIAATSVLFPGSSMERVEGIYKHNLVSEYFNEVLSATLLEYLRLRKEQDPAMKVRILEAGAGTGGTSYTVLHQLAPYKAHIAEYCYTDVSKAFLQFAEQTYGPSFPYLTYQLFDVEKPIEEQGIPAGAFDIVISANALHATHNIRQTLRNIKASMKKSGLLLLNEMCVNPLFPHLTFGLLDGWWLYEDPALRMPGCPGLSPASWKRVMEETGLDPVVFPVAAAADLDFQIIVAESDGIVRQPEQQRSSVAATSTVVAPPAMRNEPPQPAAKPLQQVTAVAAGVTDQMIEEHIRMVLHESIATVLMIKEDRILDERSFSEYGIDSIIAVKLINLINKECGVTLQTTVLFDYNNVNQLLRHIIDKFKPSLVRALSAAVIADVPAAAIPVAGQEQTIIAPPAYTSGPERPLTVTPIAEIPAAAMGTYHRVLLERPGGIEELRIVAADVSAPAPDEVQISVRSFSLNFADLLCLRGLYPGMPPYPFTPGVEASGVIVHVGSNVKAFRKGDEVIATIAETMGGQATHITCQQKDVFLKPASLSFEEAAALPAVAMTAIDTLHKAGLKKGERILIQTATGGTGLMLVQLALHYGAEIYATAGSQHKLDYLRQLGVQHVINYRENDFQQELMRMTGGQGVHVVVNTLSGDAMQKGMQCLAPGGRYVELAMMALKSARNIDLSIFSNNQAFYSGDVRKLGMLDHTLITSYRKEMLAMVEKGVLRPTICKQFSLESLSAAYAFLDQRENIGKVVVGIPSAYQYRAGLDHEVVSAKQTTVPVQTGFAKEDIAVIGVSGRFPQSDNIHELWEHLKEGHDLTEEVNRWDLESYYANDPEKAYCKRGGFLKDIASFDPLFFNISGAEATYMDPQQRIFLEEAWRALEDAGYAGKIVDGASCGVYVGCHVGDYHHLFDEREQPAQAMWGNAGSVIPARIAYYLNLKGPAIAVDTACSSSLVSIHLACQGLWSNETSMALAGGVFIQSTPWFYLSANKAEMLSPTGYCHTFDQQADGFVPGEGAGVVVLKRLSDALAAGDHIYGVIKGSAINQDGTTNGLTAPSALSQEQLEAKVYSSFDINPAEIQLVEAHGTGTRLGDPIEYDALTRAFARFTDEKQFCAIGSIKSNMGHAAAAAGVSGLVKLLLSLRYKQIPPSLHFHDGNTNIAFTDSPFYVNTTLRDWPQPVHHKRMAAISSFGFSGTNAHLILEEAPAVVRTHAALPGYLFVLSARTDKQLKAQVSQLLAHLSQDPDANAGNISYTLLLGRKHLLHRIACVARTTRELVNMLKKYLEKGKAPQLYTAVLTEGEFREQAALRKYGNECLRQLGQTDNPTDYLERLFSVGELFIQGYNLEYEALFTGGEYGRVPLPVYPFEKEIYWVEESVRPRVIETQLHPLLHRYAPVAGSQQFITVFRGSEYFFTGHVIQQKTILPGVAYLEMARAAIMHVLPPLPAGAVLQLKDVVLSQPLIAEDRTLTVHTRLAEDGAGDSTFEISSISADGQTILHCSGRLSVQTNLQFPSRNLSAVAASCNVGVVSGEQLYALFAGKESVYGPLFQAVQHVLTGRGISLATIQLPSSLLYKPGEYQLHPVVMDAALQSTLALSPDDAQYSALPFLFEEVTVLRSCEPNMKAVVTETSGAGNAKVRSFSIELYNEQEQLCVLVRNLHIRMLALTPAVVNETVYFLPQWRQAVLSDSGTVVADRQLVVYGRHLADRWSAAAKVKVIEDLSGTPEARFTQASLALLHILRDMLGMKKHHQQLLQVVISQQDAALLMAGFSAMLKTAHQEKPALLCQLIVVEEGTEPEQLVLQNGADPEEQLIKYENGQRYVAGFTRIDSTSLDDRMPWRQNGTYLITGGAGGLGRIFANEIARKVAGARIILTGRSAQDVRQQELLHALEESGVKAVYQQMDVSNEAAVQQVVADILRENGALHGVIHCAGITADDFIIRKEDTSFERVLAPKVNGLVGLDKVTKDLALDFFVVSSSMAGVLGNTGQVDYAAANAFMDAYIASRQQLVASGQRHGRSVSINWSLWEEGGMRPDHISENIIKETTGMLALDRQQGISAFYRALNSGLPQVMVVAGNGQRLVEAISHTVKKTVPDEKKSTVAGTSHEKAVALLKQRLSAVLKIPAAQIETNAQLEKYGIDSVMVVTLTNALEQTFGLLPKTLFFEYQTIAQLAGYFQEAFPEKIAELTGGGGTRSEHRESVLPSAIQAKMPVIQQQQAKASPQQQLEDVAIIGLAGRYPGAADINAFWENLRAGKDTVTEVPSERWAHQLFFDPAKGKAGKTYTKWGGFIDGVDEFDPRFFNISPREAVMIDPQERLFLQCVYNTMEDAGYTRQSLAAAGNVGVFAGVMYLEYQLYGLQETMAGRPVAMSGSASSIANRVSYFCNFHGPSLAVDTMCSSSLTALHLACHSLQRGECAVAIAGGVNVSIHPNKYLMLGQGGFASSKGRCESFGEGGDGYVPGEGVGAVLLKPLSRAVADGDHIYGVIRGSAINHGGKTNGYTVPNPQAQATLISTALRNAGIDARTISYIEAHGTGTSLGDPIEIAGLTKSFREYGNDVQYCAIGSAKSNIGHCESAAGIAGISKILLQLKHRELAPSLHTAQLNPNIDFASSPFQVQVRSGKWERPVVTIDGVTRQYPLRAGLSAFGAGGSNAHILIEEYVAVNEGPSYIDGPFVIVLSTKDEARLNELVSRLLASVRQGVYTDADLASIAYTLQVGREAMDERLGLIVHSLAELESLLSAGAAAIYRSEGATQAAVLSGLLGDEEVNALTDKWLRDRNYDKLLRYWVKGGTVNWELLYPGAHPQRISLPVYPFAKEKYWIVKPEHVDQLTLSLTQQGHKNLVNQDQPATVKAPVVSKEENDHRIDLTPLSVVDEIIPTGPTSVTQSIELTSEPVPLPEERVPETSIISVVAENSLVTIEETLRKSLALALGLEESEILADKNFIDLGLDSIMGVEWIKSINTAFGIELGAARLYDYPELRKLAAFIRAEQQKSGSTTSAQQEIPAAAIPVVKPALQTPAQPSSGSAIITAPSVNILKEELTRSLAGALSLLPGEISPDRNFVDMGLDSIIGVEWIHQINARYGTAVIVTKIYDHATINEFAKFLSSEMTNISTYEPVQSLQQEFSLDDVVRQVEKGEMDAEAANLLLAVLSKQ
uniref:Polyketide synthase n=1 Tax=Chitinophaga sancti TaxID=1004 RepID=F5B9D1_9BACT|nr:polyketide synthase [Chitinophaga sancti]